MFAVAGYFGLMYLIFGTVDVWQIKAQFEGNYWGYFIGFILPFTLPTFIAFFSAFAETRDSSRNSLQEALRYRNGQMRIKPDKEASKILRRTAYLDMLQSGDSEVFEQARRGFNATYGNKPPTDIFKDLMDNDA